MRSTRLRPALILALASLAIAGAGCGGDDDSENGGAAAERGAAVTIQTFIYEPDPIEVDAGATVTWTNEDDILHTVTSGSRGEPTKEFDEELDGAGTTAEVTFDEPGSYDYFCLLHDGMDGSVVVR
jgi:plastocyanin